MRSISPFSFTKYITLTVALAASVGIGACKKHDPAPDTNKAGIPQELTVAALKAAEPDKAIETFWKAMQREDLTEEQRRQIVENGEEARKQVENERLNEYFTAPEPERKSILDKQIDEFEKMRKRFEEEREKREAEREKMTEEEKQKEKERREKMWRGRGDNATKSERKTRSESRSVDQTARRMTYMAAMMSRMKERGIEPPRFGGPGGPGGRGEGRRGGG